jgi:hypothetical protein
MNTSTPRDSTGPTGALPEHPRPLRSWIQARRKPSTSTRPTTSTWLASPPPARSTPRSNGSTGRRRTPSVCELAPFTPPKVNAAGDTQRSLVYEWDNEHRVTKLTNGFGKAISTTTWTGTASWPVGAEKLVRMV